MKARRTTLLGALGLAIGLAAGPEAMAGRPGAVPLPVGHFSFTAQGTEASCSGDSCAVLNIIEAGAMIRDADGNGCGSHTAIVNVLPLSAAPPTVVPSIVTVLKVTNYDSNVGTGDESLAEYVGGSCNGATFDATGAIQVVSGTLHFTVGDGGNRIDSLITSLNIAGLGGFSISFTELQQQSAGNAP